MHNYKHFNFLLPVISCLQLNLYSDTSGITSEVKSKQVTDVKSYVVFNLYTESTSGSVGFHYNFPRFTLIPIPMNRSILLTYMLVFPYCLLTFFYYNIVAVCYIFIIVNSLFLQVLCMPLKYMQCKPIINFLL